MGFSYAVKWKHMMPPDPKAGGIVYWMGGSFTDCQAGGSTMNLGVDHGVTEILHIEGTNLTDTDENVRFAVSSAVVTMSVDTNNDDGTWEAYVLEY